MTEPTRDPTTPDAPAPAPDPAREQELSAPPASAPVAAVRGASPLAWIVSLALAAIVGALLFVGGYLAAGAAGGGSCAAPTEAFRSFCEAYDKLKAQFVDNLDDQKLAEGAIQGMFEHGVEDPFSGYMAPEDYRRALGDLSGEFSGVGAEMGVKNVDDPGNLDACKEFSTSCVLVVVSPLEDSPAKKAGLQPGDIITAIDGKPIDGLALDDAVNLIRGESGTDVTLTVKRGSDTSDLTITRQNIQMREVTSKMLQGNVGYVALHGFSDAAADQFHKAISDLLDQGATSFVFDLRNNPGGYIEAARKIASEFIGDGLIFVQESSGDEVKQWKATGDGLATSANIGLVTLVNGGSASASEIVAGALKDHGRGTIIGQPTYGKNTVQLWEQLDNGGGVRITISRWFTPDHHSVAPDGVQPDVTVDVPPETPPEEDLYVERALQILSSRATGNDGGTSPQPSAAPSSGSALVPLLSPFSYEPAGLSEAAA
jgi:carboxyl-terminal processing protease